MSGERAYLETRFISCLLLNAPGSPTAWELVRRFAAPYEVNSLHIVQIESMLFRALNGTAPQKMLIARNSLALWNSYLYDDVFLWRVADLDAGFRQAAAFVRRNQSVPIRSNQCAHVMMARLSGATYFLCFDPQTRAVATDIGLIVLPETL